MDEVALKEQLLDTYQIYIDGFKSNDMKLIDSIVQYPIAFLSNGTVKMLNQYPVNPEKLKVEKGWDHSRDWTFDIQAINDYQAHAAASAVRCRADGSIIERIHGFYAFTRIDNEWKMFALSEVIY